MDAPAPNLKRRPLFVSFSGIDGAGKSTQINALRDWLTGAGLRVRVLTFWDDVAVLGQLREFSSDTLFQGEKGVGSPDRPIERRDKNVRAWYMTPARFFLYLLDAMGVSLVMTRLPKAAGRDDVVIFDRYLDDELANLNLNHWLSKAYARLLLKIVRRPDVAYLLDADPIHARTRKPEYPLDFLQTNRASYLALSRLSGDVTVIAGATVEKTTGSVREIFLERCPDLAARLSPANSLVRETELIHVDRVG